MLLMKNIEIMWDHYCEKKFQEVLTHLEQEQNYNSDENLKEIYYLSLMEYKKDKKDFKKIETKGIFKELLSAMIDYYKNDHLSASKKLFSWILGKKIYTDWIIQRFYQSAKIANQFDLIIQLSLDLLRKEIKVEYVHNLFNAYYNLKEYEKSYKVFETYRESFSNEDLGYVGLVLIKLKKYKEAERILLYAYKQITGKEYQIHYEEYEKLYKNKYLVLKEKYNQNKIKDNKELYEFGLSCLFANDYSNALFIFSKIKKEIEKAA
ncbi:MAG: hypothetical protein ACK4UJ_03700 [Leptonema sp. (in: bacteria)]